MKLKENIEIKNTLIKELDKCSKILFIPIVSMRNHISGEYDLACDGNINRILSTISLLNENIQIDITIPKNSINEAFILSNIKPNQMINLIKEDYLYGINANETRRNKLWFKFINENIDKYDKIIFEPNIIGLLNNPEDKFIYWCPVSNTINSEVSFVKEFADLDKLIAGKYTTYVCTNSQKKYLEGKSIVDISMLSNIGKIHALNKTKVIYLPFRLSDKGYKIEYICKILKELESNYSFNIMYSSPNGVELPIKLNNVYKISSDRQFYNFMLSNKNVCIPFLENPDEILHMSLFEMIHNKTFVIGLKNKIFDFDINLNDDQELKNALITFFNL